MSKRRSKQSSAENSMESASVQSDSDDGAENESSTQSAKKTKSQDKSSAALCASLGVNDVDLEWTDADYQNLTSYNIFVRLIRPQMAAANAKLASSVMTQVLEAKWKEFQDTNPFTKKAAENKKADSSTECEDDDENKGDEAEEIDSDSHKPEESDNESETEFQAAAKSKKLAPQGLRIKLSLKPVRKSTREHRATRKSDISDKEFEKMLGDESDVDDPKDRKKRKRKRNSDSDFGDSDSNRKERRRPRKRQTRKEKSGSEGEEMSDDEDNDEDESFDQRKKKTERKRKKATRDESDNEFEGDSSQHASGTENSDDSFDSRGHKSKKKKSRPVIPGERKSNRAKKGNASLRELTDREFEKMLAEEEKQKTQRRSKSKKDDRGSKSHSRNEKRPVHHDSDSHESGEEGGKEAKKDKKLIRKSSKGDKEDGSGNESDHYWFCELCKDGGDLLLCDTCPKSFHKECLKLEIVPDGEWSCPVCTGEGLPEKGDSSEEDNHETFCRVCKDGGDVILCDFCPLVYHMNCLNPPLKSLPDGDWKCPICIIKANPPKAKVKQVLTWRWTHQPKDTDELDHTHSPQKVASGDENGETRPVKKRNKIPERELFVKYEYHSYWDCAWIPEVELEVFQSITHTFFKKKFDMNEPPALEDGSSFGRPRHKNASSEDDPHNLEEKFYRYGIKPEWLQIHRIITHDGKGKERRYLVKWRDLPYSECTWEFPDDIPEGLEGFDKHVEIYWARRKQKTSKDERELKKSEIPKKSLLRKKFETQPSFIDESGGTLHPYQLEGLNWLRFSWSQGTNTILADEMGLGKTIQAISFLYTLYKEGYVTTKPFLVSAPLSTVPNWEREFEFWAPELYVVTYTGGKDNRMVIREQEFSYKEGAFSSTSKPCKLRDGHKPKFDVLLTSYEYIHMDFATLSSIEWGVLIIDEAHRLKNHQSLFFRTMNDYKINYKLLLTGTPLQNNLEELFNLLNFLEREKFANMEEFLKEFSEVSKDEQVLKLHDMLAPHMLRRMKMDVLKDIPSKSEFIVRIELSAMQKKYYKHILTKNYEALNAKGYSNQTSLINIMMDLRKCCNHPYLFPGAEKDAPLTNGGMYEGTSMTKASGKLEMLEKMLRKLRRDGHRVLIFSQMTRMLDVLEDFLTAHGYGYERIDGSIAGSKRQESIDRFNSSESTNFVFLLSTRAGGLGINLATADTVIIYDMDWNPHNDIQAFSRAHRIGQKNKVMIYRYVTRNTVEEKIAQVCKTKMMLSELIVHRGMGGGGVAASNEKRDSLTKQEISDILKYGAENLFNDDEEGQVVYSDEAIEKLLDRSQEVEAEKEKEFGMNEYLRSFKVASYQVKEGVDDEEEMKEDEKEEEEEKPVEVNDKDRHDNETDVQYWQRVLGPAYHDHVVQTLREQEELAKTLGKGKRIRKQINYAEKEMMDAAEAQSKNKKKAAQDEDITFQSDYEPTSESDDEDASGPEEEGVDKEAAKKRKAAKPNAPTPIPKPPPVALPPLVERNDGQVLVLGFTARQRRAFLDAVMRYGMPPEDPFRSQWLVRDLRSKPERVFKAYVSLFMRHLCEPIADSADKFADGVPREGLSRQHVLTRIGIIALIRKKVHEFEEVNGVDSMIEFRSPPAEKDTTKVAEKDTEKNSEKESEKKSDDKKTDDAVEKKAEDEVEKSKKEEEAKEDSMSGAKDPAADSENKDGEEKDKKDTAAEEKSEESKKMEVDDVKDEGEKEEGEKKSEDSGKKAEEEMEVDKSEEKVDEEGGKGGQDVEMKDSKEEDADKNEKKDDEVKEKEKTDEGEKKEPAEDADKVKKDDEAGTSKVNKETKDEGEKKDDVEKKTTEDVEKKTTDDVDKTEEKKAADNVDKKTTDDVEKKAEDSKSVTVASSAAPNTSAPIENKTNVNGTDKPDVLLTSVKTAADIAAELRKRFWIADGGFTELQSLWHLEEMQLVEKKEFETWHRRHDFWLLAGVITHGYRHWQDILSDPRFDLMNQAFKSDSERTRKAAFLNRRFQLLEQALVIEEQLRKAVAENVLGAEQTVSINSTNPSSALDRLQMLDDLAANLKSLSTTPSEKSLKTSKLHKVLNQIAALVNDINDMSYLNMPASLAKAYNANVTKAVINKMPPTKVGVPAPVTHWSGFKSVTVPNVPAVKTPVHYAQLPHTVSASPSGGISIGHSPLSAAASTSTPKSSSNEKSKDVICID